MSEPSANANHDRRALALKAVLLVVMFLVSFGASFFARELSFFTVLGWPLHFWIAAQGGVLVFIAIVAVYAWAMTRLEAQDEQAGQDEQGGGSHGG